MTNSDTLHKQDPTLTAAWNKLTDHFQDMKDVSMAKMFAEDSKRAKDFALELEEVLFLDYSKNLINGKTMALLSDLAEELDLKDGIDKMFAGKLINETEGRAVLHTALRAPRSAHIEVYGENVVPKVQEVLARMKDFVGLFDDKKWKGYTGKDITDFVNIGIGGSDLGPVMVCEALTPFHHPDRKVHFVSNVDGAHIEQTLAALDPETTLFIIASKTFTTIETMTNAHSAREWFLEGASQNDVKKHFVALSTNIDAAVAFGIGEENIFEFWDWVGGRYSLSSAIGLSILVAIGADHFSGLLSGMHWMDNHFRSAPPLENIPVVLALLGIWYSNFHGCETEAILPYDQNLRYLPSYLQQASMESNGKMVTRAGSEVSYETGSIIWGDAGTNSQHSFFQLLHQGTRLIPCDFLLPAIPNHSLDHHHTLLAANAFAQCEALMTGKSADQVKLELAQSGKTDEAMDQLLPFKVFDGNRPSNMILLKRLTPFSLGAIIAMYEHKIFVQGYIWNIFSFDQFGVELGKALAKDLAPELTGSAKSEMHDASTNQLVAKFKSLKSN
ncbi:MAG: glucose-6-phosphate isomerase [Saprospiraceae bacterium]|nr:glucose-6-phosphate isomerase [Saprospiraceae bacterium]